MPEFIAPIFRRNCSKTSAGPAIKENEVDRIAWQFWHIIRPGVEILKENICVNRLVSYKTFKNSNKLVNFYLPLIVRRCYIKVVELTAIVTRITSTQPNSTTIEIRLITLNIKNLPVSENYFLDEQSRIYVRSK